MDRVAHTAAEYAERYPWADIEALKLYFRIDATNMALREAGTRAHSGTSAETKRWMARIVRALYMAPGYRLSHAEIAKETGVPPANVTYQVDALRDEGYVQRVPHPTDRRITHVKLTRKGEEYCDRIIPRWTRFMTNIGESFTTEEKRFLNELLERLQALAESSGPVVDAGLPRTTDRD